MKLHLKKLSLQNFKGQRKLTISFDETTNIFGDNGTGKTTVFDAFLWLLFGKDSTDRKDFEIKTLDENNQPFHKLEHEVSAQIFIDGIEQNIRRTLKEKWAKKRGTSTEEFTGHETGYFWNDVPMQQGEFQTKVAEIVNEGLFKLLTNCTYFAAMKWQDRRVALLSLAGHIDDMLILAGIKGVIDEVHYKLIENAIGQKKNKDNFKEFKAELGAKKKKVKDELDLLPSRIAEAKLAIPDELNYEELETQLSQVQLDLQQVESFINNKSRAAQQHQENINTLITKKQGLSRLLGDIEFTEKNNVHLKGQQRQQKINEQVSELRQAEADYKAKQQQYLTVKGDITKANEEKQQLTDQWVKVDAETLVFKDGEFCCPACKREFEALDVEAKKTELTQNFNTSKSNRLAEISGKGNTAKEKIATLETKLGNVEAEGKDLKLLVETRTEIVAELEKEHRRLSQDEAGEFEKAIAANKQYQQYLQERTSLEEEINKPFEGEDNSGLKLRHQELGRQVIELNKQLGTKETRIKQQSRVAELEEQESAMSQELASYEGVEFSLNQFTKAKMDALETAINGKFAIVKFKLFEKQINGGEVECCDILIKGVPYADANTASKINAGLDIINTLSSHYNVYAPIFIDNRESVVSIPHMESQIINMWVWAPDKKLRITTGEVMALGN